jgi:hypothetical protein
MNEATGETKEVPLRKSITVSGVLTKALRMREPTVADQLAMDKFTGSEADKELFMLANLCGVAPMDLHGLTMRDYKALQGAFLGFIE